MPPSGQPSHLSPLAMVRRQRVRRLMIGSLRKNTARAWWASSSTWPRSPATAWTAIRWPSRRQARCSITCAIHSAPRFFNSTASAITSRRTRWSWTPPRYAIWSSSSPPSAARARRRFFTPSISAPLRLARVCSAPGFSAPRSTRQKFWRAGTRSKSS